MHSLDYDLYLADESRKADISPELIVFLDAWYPFHQDYIMGTGRSKISPVTADRYYNSLNQFFDQIEQSFNMKVQIAAHPRSFYNAPEYEKMDYYKGRMIIRNQTQEMVKNSKFVVAHMSASLGFAILYEKPLLFISTDQIEDSKEGDYQKAVAKLLGKVVINVDRPYRLEQNEIMKIDKNLYRQYKNDYIKKEGTPEKKMFQVVADELKKY